MARRPYHHGDLRSALLAAAADAIEDAGPAALSLRDLARRVGVSHAAPTHHFGDKRGLLTALATEGFEMLADALEQAGAPDDLVELGVTYVGFAVSHRAHFEVMFRPDELRAGDSPLLAAQVRAQEALRHGVAELSERRGGEDVEVASAAAWSLVHGFATLWLQRALPTGLGDSPESAARAVATLFVDRGRPLST